MFGRALIVAPAILLAACGAETVAVQPEQDPVMTAALNDLLLTDPDLVGRNDAASALLLPGLDASVPVEDDSSSIVAAARAEALVLAGGPGRMQRAPAPERSDRRLPPGGELSVIARAAAVPGTSRSCAEAASYTAAWAARMPDAFPVYPQGAVQEAAGTDDGRCALRAVSFTTPVPLGEVIDFYFTRAGSAGFSAKHEILGGETALAGAKGARSFAVFARRRADGMTLVDLVTVGG